MSGVIGHPQTGMEPVLLERMFLNKAAMWHKQIQRYPCRIPLEPSETPMKQPNMQTLAGSMDANLLQVAEWIYKAEYMVAPSVFTCTQCDDLMKELQRQLSGHLTWAGLQGKRGQAKLTSRSHRHSQGPEEDDQALETKQQDRWSKLGERRTCSRGRSGWKRQQIPSLHNQAGTHTPPHNSMESLKLHLKSRDSKDRAQ